MAAGAHQQQPGRTASAIPQEFGDPQATKLVTETLLSVGRVARLRLPRQLSTFARTQGVQTGHRTIPIAIRQTDRAKGGSVRRAGMMRLYGRPAGSMLGSTQAAVWGNTQHCVATEVEEEGRDDGYAQGCS